MNKSHENKFSSNLLLKPGYAMLIIAALFFLYPLYVAPNTIGRDLFMVFIPAALIFTFGVIMIVGGLIIKEPKK